MRKIQRTRDKGRQWRSRHPSCRISDLCPILLSGNKSTGFDIPTEEKKRNKRGIIEEKKDRLDRPAVECLMFDVNRLAWRVLRAENRSQTRQELMAGFGEIHQRITICRGYVNCPEMRSFCAPRARMHYVRRSLLCSAVYVVSRWASYWSLSGGQVEWCGKSRTIKTLDILHSNNSWKNRRQALSCRAQGGLARRGWVIGSERMEGEPGDNDEGV